MRIKENKRSLRQRRSKSPSRRLRIVLLTGAILLFFALVFSALDLIMLSSPTGPFSQKPFGASRILAERQSQEPCREPRRLTIDIKHIDFQRLAYNRQRALNRGMIITTPESYVPALISAEGLQYPVRIRLKGDIVDHVQGEKWSLRIKVKDGKAIWGMRHFSIQDPRRSGFVLEWIFHRLMEYEGLIGLRYDFIGVSINGDDKGIYAIEENFAKELIEHNHRLNGPILKFDESLLMTPKATNRGDAGRQADIFFLADINHFDSSRLLSDETMTGLYYIARTMLDDFRTGRKKLSKIFDLDKTARLFAALHLLSGYHAIRWKNIRFYFNPVIQKIEPIAYNLFGPSDNFPRMSELYYQSWKNERVGRHHVFEWIDLFFSDRAFTTRYFGELNRICRPGYLETFFSAIERDLTQKTCVVSRDYPFFNVPIDNFYANRDLAREILHNEVPLKAYLKKYEPEPGTAVVTVANTSFLPVTIRSLDCGKSGKTFDPKNKEPVSSKISGRPLEYVDIHLTDLDTSDSRCFGHVVRSKDLLLIDGLTIKYEVLGTGRTRVANIQAHPARMTSYFLPSLDDVMESLHQFEERGLLSIDSSNRRIVISPGDWHLAEDLLVPAGLVLEAGAGTHIFLEGQAAIVSLSPLAFEGTPEDPIIISGKNGAGQGIAVLAAARPSHLKHVVFKSLGEVNKNGWRLSGGVTFFESVSELQRVTFTGSRTEDALHIVRSDYSVSDCSFSDTSADAIDVDFGDGTINRVTFNDCGNDCIDLSGSSSRFRSIVIRGAGDKGISVGEKSNATLKKARITGADIAVAGKDGSKLTIEDLQIEDCRVGLAAYRKKPEYEGAVLRVRQTEMQRVRQARMADKFSRIEAVGLQEHKGTDNHE